MGKAKEIDINEILLEAHARSIERARDVSIRTGTPLIVYKNGKLVEVMPKYKYVRVPIKSPKKKKAVVSKK